MERFEQWLDNHEELANTLVCAAVVAEAVALGWLLKAWVLR